MTPPTTLYVKAIKSYAWIKYRPISCEYHFLFWKGGAKLHHWMSGTQNQVRWHHPQLCMSNHCKVTALSNIDQSAASITSCFEKAELSYTTEGEALQNKSDDTIRNSVCQDNKQLELNQKSTNQLRVSLPVLRWSLTLRHGHAILRKLTILITFHREGLFCMLSEFYVERIILLGGVR